MYNKALGKVLMFGFGNLYLHFIKPTKMRLILLSALFVSSITLNAQVQISRDDFEGNSTISTWFGDDCGMDNNFNNPVRTGINTSTKVLKYTDAGGLYANVRFDAGFSYNLATSSVFSLKIYVPSNSVTGNQRNQISLKLQNGTMASPWATQCEIIKPIVLNQWQTITFDFATDPYLNLDPNSPNPLNRFDFTRVVLQLNGENNTSQVMAYIDDFLYSGAASLYNNLVWSDEFTGNTIDASKWHHQTRLPSGGSWHNGELQHYTNRTANSFVSNGALSIVAKRETFTDQNVTKDYTSARLNSKFAFRYGRIEARAKLATGSGTWPAFWTLGKNIIEPGAFFSSTHGTIAWPACGEMDIMEHWGRNQNFVQSAIHTPSSFGNTVNLGGRSIANVSNQFNVYAMEWTPTKLTFMVNNIVHYVYEPAVRDADTWPFDAEQYILLNVAIEPSVNSNFVQSAMEVDYVRVYQQGSPSSVTEAQETEVRLFPNPVSQQLTVEISDQEIGSSMSIYNIMGQLVETLVLNDKSTTMDVSAFQTGLYMVQLNTPTGVRSAKFVKQ